jgi:adenosylmethionine-8-amino-7-oxononanoate aminotransferase
LTKAPLNGLESELVRETLTAELDEQGLIARVETRGISPAIVLSPPLVAGEEQFEEIHAALNRAITAAAGALGRRDG